MTADDSADLKILVELSIPLSISIRSWCLDCFVSQDLAPLFFPSPRVSRQPPASCFVFTSRCIRKVFIPFHDLRNPYPVDLSTEPAPSNLNTLLDAPSQSDTEYGVPSRPSKRRKVGKASSSIDVDHLRPSIKLPRHRRRSIQELESHTENYLTLARVDIDIVRDMVLVQSAEVSDS